MMMKKQFLVSVGLLFLVTAALYGGVVIPTTISIMGIRKDIAAEHAKIQDRYVRRGQLKDSLRNLSEVRSGIGALTAIAVRQGHELDFVQSLESAASETGVVQDLQLQTANQTELSTWERTVPVSIKVEGSYANVLHYLKKMEKLPYYIDVSAFTVRSTRPVGAPATTPANVIANLSGSVYWLTDAIPSYFDTTKL